jgi:hypothetical protein
MVPHALKKMAGLAFLAPQIPHCTPENGRHFLNVRALILLCKRILNAGKHRYEFSSD